MLQPTAAPVQVMQYRADLRSYLRPPHRYELLVPKRSSLRHRLPDADEGLLSFVSCLLHIDPNKRPTAAEALQHPWLQKEYPSLDM